MELLLQLVVGLLQELLLVGVLHQVPDALALGDLQLLLEVSEHLRQMVGALLGLGHVLPLPGQVLIEPLDHAGRVLHHLPDIALEQLVQLIGPDVVGGAALPPPAVVGAAGVGRAQVSPAHGKQGGPAVPADQEAGVHVVVLLHPPVVGDGALLPQGPGSGEGAVVDDGLVVVLNDDLLLLVLPHVPAVDLLPGVLPLAQGPDVEVVIQDALDRYDGPGGLHLALVLLSGGLLPVPLRHAGGGDALVSEIARDFLVAPALVVVKAEDGAHDVGLGGDDLELLPLVDDVAVGCGADPSAVCLPPLDDVLHLFAGVGDRHLVDEELELDLQPVIVVGKVDVVPDGDDAHPRVPQVLQLHQSPAVPPGEPGEVLDDEDVILMAHQALPHGLVPLPLLEGVAGAVPVLVEGEDAAGEPVADKILHDGLLVFNGDIVPVQLVVHRDAAVPGDLKGLGHVPSPPFRSFPAIRSEPENPPASCQEMRPLRSGAFRRLCEGAA